MNLDDLRKLATGSILFSLDRIIGPRLINLLYLLGLAAIALWAIAHLVTGLSLGVGEGLWALIEIAVLGLLGLVGLRLVAEVLILFFKTNEETAAAATRTRPSISLLEEVGDAISDLAGDEEDEALAAIAPPPEPKPAKRRTARSPATPRGAATKAKKPVTRTARRTPRKEPDTGS